VAGLARNGWQLSPEFPLGPPVVDFLNTCLLESYENPIFQEAAPIGFLKEEV